MEYQIKFVNYIYNCRDFYIFNIYITTFKIININNKYEKPFYSN